jgi:hypothetical protein
MSGGPFDIVTEVMLFILICVFAVWTSIQQSVELVHKNSHCQVSYSPFLGP